MIGVRVALNFAPSLDLDPIVWQILRAAHLAGEPHTIWIRNVLLRAARRVGATATR